jgi:hypothetical protein
MSFSSFNDLESPIVRLEAAVGLLTGTSIATEHFLSFQDIPLRSTLFGTQSVSLLDGSTVVGSVRATNAAGLSSIIFTNGLMLDSTPPEIAVATDGPLVDGQPKDISWMTGQGSISHVFSCSDVHTSIAMIRFETWIASPNSALVRVSSVTFDLATLASQILTKDTATVTIIGQGNGAATFVYSMPISHLGILRDGSTVVAQVIVYNRAGLSSIRSTSGVRLDNTPPEFLKAPVVGSTDPNDAPLSDSDSIYLLSGGDELQAHWNVVDKQSGLNSCVLQVASISKAQAIISVSNPMATSLDAAEMLPEFSTPLQTGLQTASILLIDTLPSNVYFQAIVVCTNVAGLVSGSRSRAFRLPEQDRVGSVLNGPNHDNIIVQSHGHVAGSFSGWASELCGGILHYKWGMGTSAYSTDVLSFSSQGITVENDVGAFQATIDVDAIAAEILYVTVRAVTLCRKHVAGDHPGIDGLFGRHYLDASSSGFTIVTALPAVKNVTLGALGLSKPTINGHMLPINKWQTLSQGVNNARTFLLQTTSEDGLNHAGYTIKISESTKAFRPRVVNSIEQTYSGGFLTATMLHGAIEAQLLVFGPDGDAIRVQGRMNLGLCPAQLISLLHCRW